MSEQPSLFEFHIEFIVECIAPSEEAARKITADVTEAALRTNVRFRDGRIERVLPGLPRKQRRRRGA
jgi:hypothetical protein